MKNGGAERHLENWVGSSRRSRTVGSSRSCSSDYSIWRGLQQQQRWMVGRRVSITSTPVSKHSFISVNMVLRLLASTAAVRFYFCMLFILSFFCTFLCLECRLTFLRPQDAAGREVG